MTAFITLIQVALVGIVAWLTVRSLVTGEVALNFQVVKRRQRPVAYWIAIAIACLLLYLWGTPLIRTLLG
jgi:uncharacterized membrane-anchored protein